MDTSKGYALEVGKAENSILFEPFIMSILLGQEKRLKALEEKPRPTDIGGAPMEDVKDQESIEAFKIRLNYLSEKLRKISTNPNGF